MSTGYVAPSFLDRFGNVPPLSPPPGPALASNSAGLAVSSVVALDGRATMVQVTGATNTVVGKFFGTGVANPSVTLQNFDFSVPANWTNYQVIPQSVLGSYTIGSVVGGFGSMNGLYTQMAVMGVGGTATSILVTQY
jgi:hypothetical protein